MSEENVVEAQKENIDPVGFQICGKLTWGIGFMPYDGTCFLNKNGIGFKLHLVLYAIKFVYWFKQ